MDKPPIILPLEVRKAPDIPDDLTPNWQENIDSVELAQNIYDLFQEVLKEYGVDLAKNVKVLEVGSGNAILLDYLKKQGVDVVGTDAQPRGTKESPEMVIARIEQLPFPDKSFDVVLSSTVFDDTVYEQDQNLMMQDIARVLKPQGIYLGYGEFYWDVLPIEGFDRIFSNVYITAYRKS